MPTKTTAIVLAVAALSLAGCGGSKTQTSAAELHHKEDWKQAQKQARSMVLPEEASLGWAQSRKAEQEDTENFYRVLLAREEATPKERQESESPEQTPAKEEAERQVRGERGEREAG